MFLNIKSLITFTLLLLLLSTAHAERTHEKINYLITLTRYSQLTFIRNGKEYNSNQAARLLKWKYRDRRQDIQSVEDFIKLAASRSAITGKPYMIKDQNGNLLPSEIWLRNALENYPHLPK